MKQKKHYCSPSIETFKVNSTSMLQSTTGAEIPDSGWGAKQRMGDDFFDEIDNLDMNKLW